MSTNETAPSKMNRNLTSFRAFAFLAVFVFHSSARAFDAGYLGVQAFFVLSGFLITPIILKMKDGLSPWHFFKNFYGRRSLRIFPLYFLYLIVAWLLCQWVISSGNKPLMMTNFMDSVAWSFTYTYNFYHATADFKYSLLVTHFWSLAVEEQFYLVWPILLFAVPGRFVKPALILAVVVGPLVRLMTELIVVGGYVPGLMVERVDLVLYVLPFSHIDAFAVGGLFALFVTPRPRLYSWYVIIITLAIGFGSEYFINGSFGELGAFGYPSFMAGKYVWGYTVVNLCFAFLLVQIRAGLFLNPVFQNGVVHYLGKISYGLYVFHLPMLWLVPIYFPNTILFADSIIALILTIIVSGVSFHFVELPFIQLKDRFFPRTKSEPARPVSAEKQ